jgi:hypothetical protein
VLVTMTPEGARPVPGGGAGALAGIDEHFCRYLTPEQGRTLASILSHVHQPAAEPSASGP